MQWRFSINKINNIYFDLNKCWRGQRGGPQTTKVRLAPGTAERPPKFLTELFLHAQPDSCCIYNRYRGVQLTVSIFGCVY